MYTVANSVVTATPHPSSPYVFLLISPLQGIYSLFCVANLLPSPRFLSSGTDRNAYIPLHTAPRAVVVHVFHFFFAPATKARTKQNFTLLRMTLFVVLYTSFSILYGLMGVDR